MPNALVDGAAERPAGCSSLWRLALLVKLTSRNCVSYSCNSSAAIAAEHRSICHYHHRCKQCNTLGNTGLASPCMWHWLNGHQPYVCILLAVQWQISIVDVKMKHVVSSVAADSLQKLPHVLVSGHNHALGPDAEACVVFALAIMFCR